MSTAVITRVTPLRPVSAPRAVRPALSTVPAGELRLTARGRLVVFAAGLLVLLAAAVFLGASSVATERPEQTRVVTVTPGDSLWAIAAETADGGDVRTAMADIRDLNDLSSSELRVGQRLRVPVAR